LFPDLDLGITDAEYAAALLFAVEPSDRALAGWRGNPASPRWLEIVARLDERERQRP
jgi:hypothetical protein